MERTLVLWHKNVIFVWLPTLACVELKIETIRASGLRMMIHAFNVQWSLWDRLARDLLVSKKIMQPAPASTLSANDGRFNRNLDTSHTDDINQKFFISQVNLIDEFDILQIVGEGWFGKILLTEHRSTQTEMVLKALPKAYTGLSDFFREFHYGLHLAAHRNIITTYDVAFETAGFYVFSQEYAPLGKINDLCSLIYLACLFNDRALLVSEILDRVRKYTHTFDLYPSVRLTQLSQINTV